MKRRGKIVPYMFTPYTHISLLSEFTRATQFYMLPNTSVHIPAKLSRHNIAPNSESAMCRIDISQFLLFVQKLKPIETAVKILSSKRIF